jgi:hypothetical protein
MKHPIEKYNKQQAETLEKLPPEQRHAHKLLFSIANAAYCYHQESELTVEDYENWLEGLKPNMRKIMEEQGFEECKTIFALKRHAQERRDIGMDAWMKEHLTEEEYEFWKTLGKEPPN